MQYYDYYVIPESKMDELFIDQEMSFLLDVSVKNRSKIKTPEEYALLVRNKYYSWLNKEISYC